MQKRGRDQVPKTLRPGRHCQVGAARWLWLGVLLLLLLVLLLQNQICAACSSEVQPGSNAAVRDAPTAEGTAHLTKLSCPAFVGLQSPL
jgi:hypothetical protein